MSRKFPGNLPEMSWKFPGNVLEMFRKCPRIFRKFPDDDGPRIPDLLVQILAGITVRDPYPAKLFREKAMYDSNIQALKSLN